MINVSSVYLDIFITAVILIVNAAGALNFPYVPMFFGIYGAERYSFRGKIVLRLLWLFPVISVVSLLAAWALNSFYGVLPLLYLLLLFLFRGNRNSKRHTKLLYKSSEENFDALKYQVEYFLHDESLSVRGRLLFKINLSEYENLDLFRKYIKELYGVGLVLNDDKHSDKYHSVSFELVLEDEPMLESVRSAFDAVWKYRAEVVSVSVIDDLSGSPKRLVAAGLNV